MESQIRDQTSLKRQISLFVNRVQNRSFDDGTLRILELILASKDVESLIGVRSTLEQFMRNESVVIFREIGGESLEIKLLCSDFLVRVFAVIGDIESCLVLRYEALVLREEKVTSHPLHRVSIEEWLNFIEHSFERGFYAISTMACEKALVCASSSNTANLETSEDDLRITNEIKRLKCAAQLSISSQSVHSETEAYLKHKNAEHSSAAAETDFSSGSSRFRIGIKKRNLRRLQQYRCL